VADVLFSAGGPLADYMARLETLADELVDGLSDFDLLDEPAEVRAHNLQRFLMPLTPRLMLDRVTPQVEDSSEGPIARFVVPFSGTGALLSMTPESMAEPPPAGKVAGALVIVVPLEGIDLSRAETTFQATVEAIDRWLERVEQQLTPLGPRLAARLLPRVNNRREALIRELEIDPVSYRAQAGIQVERIELAELRELIESGTPFTLLDVLGEDHWNRAHLPGSHWVDFSALAREVRRRFHREERIVVYCSGAG